MLGVTIQAGGRVILCRFWLKTLVSIAYQHNLPDHQSWRPLIEKDSWIIEAKVPANITDPLLQEGIDDPRLRQMVQALLVDRFQLRINRETRIGDVYQLTRTSRPLRLTVWDGKMPSEREAFANLGSIGYAVGTWGIFRTSMEQLAQYIAEYRVRAPVVDMTDLSGL
jgi:uncharacterized protein (TIGR03435 family)